MLWAIPAAAIRGRCSELMRWSRSSVARRRSELGRPAGGRAVLTRDDQVLTHFLTAARGWRIPYRRQASTLEKSSQPSSGPASLRLCEPALSPYLMAALGPSTPAAVGQQGARARADRGGDRAERTTPSCSLACAGPPPASSTSTPAARPGAPAPTSCDLPARGLSTREIVRGIVPRSESGVVR